MAANRTISIRLTVAEADQFKQAFAQAGAAGQSAMNTLTQSVNSSTGALKSHTQAAGLAQYQIVELTESAHKFADIILSGGSAIRGLEFELPKFIGIAGGVTQALGAIGKALPLLGIAAAVGGIYELGKAANDQQSRMALLGQQVRATRDDYESYSATLEKTARQLAQHTTLSTADARTAVNTIGTNPNFSGNSADITRLSKDAQDLSVIFKTDLAGGTKIITDGLNNAAKAAKELEEKGIAGFTPGLVRSIELLQQSGKFADAFSLYLKTLEARSSGAADAGLTPLGAALKRLDEAFNGARDGGKSFAEDVGGFIDAMVARGITNLSRLIETLHSLPSSLPAALNAAAPAMPDSGGRSVLLGPGTSRGIFQLQDGADADVRAKYGNYGGRDSTDSAIYGGMAYLQMTGSAGAFHLGTKGAGEDPAGAAAYTSSVSRQDVSKLPTDVAGQIEYWGQILGMSPDMIDLGKHIAMQESGGREYGNSGRAAAATPGFTLPTPSTASMDEQRRILGTLPNPSTFGPAANGYADGGMINDGRKSDEQTEAEIAGTRAVTGEKLAAVLEGIEKQLQAFETSGRQGTTEYAGLLQREQATQAAIRNNISPQQQFTREQQDQLDSQRLARRYGFTPADQQLAATSARRQEISRSSGDPVTQKDTDADTAAFYTKANMELTRLEATQAASVAANDRLTAAYAKGDVAVADYTARNQALQALNLVLPQSAANYQAALDKLTASYRAVAQSAENARAAQTVANDNKAAAGSAEQMRLLNSGESQNQQAQDYAAFQARQANDTASPSAQDAVASAARNKAQADQALSSTRANYNELQSFGSNTFDRLGSSMTSAFSSGTNAAKSFSNIALSAVNDVAQELMKLAVLDPLKNAAFGGNSPTLTGSGGILGSLLGGGGGADNYGEGAALTAASSTSSGALSGIGSFFSGLFHGGGIVGTEGGARWVDPRVFYGATRYHTGGIAGDEVPAVLQAGEGVFTAGQMAALGANSNSAQSGDTHFNFNVNAQGAGPREIDQLKAQIPLIALQATQQAAQRGGSYAKAMRGG